MDEAIAIWRQLGSPNVMAFANALHSAAIMSRDSGDLASALALFLESLELERSILDPDHPEIALTLNNLAGLHEARGEMEKAESLYLETLRIQSALGTDHVDVGTTHNNLGGLLRQAERYEESEEHFGEALRIYREVLGAEHAWVAIVFGNLARLHEAAGNCDGVKPAVEEFVRIAEIYWEPHHPRLAAVRSTLGPCLARDGRFTEAESLLVASHEQIVTGAEVVSADARDSARRLIDLYERWGRPDRADPYRTLVSAGREP